MPIDPCLHVKAFPLDVIMYILIMRHREEWPQPGAAKIGGDMRKIWTNARALTEGGPAMLDIAKGQGVRPRLRCTAA